MGRVTARRNSRVRSSAVSPDACQDATGAGYRQGIETPIVRAMTSTRAPQSSTTPSSATPAAPEWSIEDAKTLYNVDGWGAGFIDMNATGHVVVRPDPNRPDRTLDLHELAMDLADRVEVDVVARGILGVVELDGRAPLLEPGLPIHRGPLGHQERPGQRATIESIQVHGSADAGDAPGG